PPLQGSFIRMNGIFDLMGEAIFGSYMKMVSWQVLKGRYIGRIQCCCLGQSPERTAYEKHDRSQGWQSCWPQDRSEEFDHWNIHAHGGYLPPFGARFVGRVYVARQ